MTREHKLALIVGFALVLVVGILISDHFSKARQSQVAADLDVPDAADIGSGDAGLDLVTEPAIEEVAYAPRQPAAPVDPLPALREPARPTPAIDDIVMSGTRRVPFAESGQQYADASVDQDPVLREHFEVVSPAPALASVDREPQPVRIGGGPTPVGVEASAPAPSPAPAQPEVPMRRYDVREGDSIYRIAQEVYGDGTLWPKLREFNKDKISDNGSLRHGVTLLLPPVEVVTGKPAGAPAAAPAKPKTETKPAERAVAKVSSAPQTRGYTTYTVQRGDMLGEVARRTLGTSKRWREIAELNKDVLEDPDSLITGMKLKIPTR